MHHYDIFYAPFLLIIVFYRKGFSQLSGEIKAQPIAWLLWSFVGFVLFYAPLTYAAAFGPGWLVSGTWQFTIVAGVLLAPLLFRSLLVKQCDKNTFYLFAYFMCHFSRYFAYTNTSCTISIV